MAKVEQPDPDCPYEVRVSPRFGRYLIASRDLKARELIISEEPLIQGPTDDPGNIPTCLSCCKKLEENPFSRCSKCHFPLCGQSCETEPIHASNECLIFSQNHVQFPPPYPQHILNKCVLILRCLLLKERDTEKWSKLMTMSDNRESRRNRPNCITADDRILENFANFFPTERLIEQIERESPRKCSNPFRYDTQEVLNVSGILDVNAHAFPVKVDGKFVACKCHLYHKTSLLAHSCTPNASWSPDKLHKSTLVIRTNIPISKGQLISVAYDDGPLLYGTLRRLLPMEISGMFICKCERCKDPTEFGTFLSSLKCLECAEGYLLSLDPTDSFSDWKCDSEKCAKIFDEELVSLRIDEVEGIVGFPREEEDDEEEDIEMLKEFVETFGGKVIHKNHYVIQEVNLRIVKSLCYNLEEMSYVDLEDYLGRCKSLMEIADILTPGFCEYRAYLQYHYFRGLLHLQEREYSSIESGKDANSKCNNASTKKESDSDRITRFLKTYKLIHKLQEEVLVFLEEKFTSTKRVDYVKESIVEVQDQIGILENLLTQSQNL